MRLHIAKQLRHVVGLCAIAADDPVLSEYPYVTKVRHGIDRRLGRIVWISHPLRVLRHQLGEFVISETHKAKIEAVLCKLAEFNTQKLIVPSRVESELVVGQDIGAPLGFGPSARHHDGHSIDTELAGRHHAPMTSNDAALLVNKYRVSPPPLANRGRNLRDLLIRVRARIASIRDKL